MTQETALDILKTGRNVYLTGCAGSGKTYVLSKYLEYLSQQQIPVGVTASTGIASTHLSGMTIHAWSGIGLRAVVTKHDIDQLQKRRYLLRRLEQVEVLIIDEVSMLSGSALESVNRVCQSFKRSSLPFGGMQVVLCGDFFQLPPVGREMDSAFIYKSEIWESLQLQVCYLHKTYRQKDERLVQLLSDIRKNSLSSDTWKTLRERFIDPVIPGMTPTRLFTHNTGADTINNQELVKLSSQEYRYEATVQGDEFLAQVLRSSSLIPKLLRLKDRALVMFIKNSTEDGYVNGTMGRIIGFKSGFPTVQTFDRREILVSPVEWVIEDEANGEKAVVSQIPLRLAWAITIHKSQGMSLDAAEIDLGKSFVPGMGYVALSRVKSLAGLRLRSINPTALRVNEEVIEFDKELQLDSEKADIEIRDYKWNNENLGKITHTVS